MPETRTTARADALRAADLSAEDIRLASEYLFDRRSQSEIARDRNITQTAVSLRLRVIMNKLEVAGLPVTRPKRRCSKPAWMPARPRMVATDPDTMSRMSITIDSSGMIHGKFNGTGDRAELPMADDDSINRKTR